MRIKKKTWRGLHYEQQEGRELGIKESLKIRGLLPFSISHNEIIKFSENIGIKSTKIRPF
jgi:hypothetical protein